MCRTNTTLITLFFMMNANNFVIIGYREVDRLVTSQHIGLQTRWKNYLSTCNHLLGGTLSLICRRSSFTCARRWRMTEAWSPGPPPSWQKPIKYFKSFLCVWKWYKQRSARLWTTATPKRIWQSRALLESSRAHRITLSLPLALHSCYTRLKNCHNLLNSFPERIHY